MLTTVPHNRADRNTDLRVLHLLRAPVGGLFRHVCDLAREQCARDLNVGIVCDSSTGTAFTDSALGSLADVCELGIHRVPMRRKPGPADWSVARAINRIASGVSPNILHGHGAKGAAYTRLLASRLRAKAIYTPHGGSLHFSYATLSGGLYLTLERLLKRRTDACIFESKFALKSYLDNVGPIDCPYRVIHNGLHESEFAELPSQAATYDFVFIGELRTLKGIYTFLDAISEVARLQSLSILIVGQGDQESSVRSRVAELDLAESVKMSPSIHPASKVFASAGCVVAPSFAESFPYIVLECLAAGVPLLTTSVGGIPEIFGPFSDQLLPPGDPHALADAMRAVLRDLEGAKEKSAALQSHVRERFLVTQMVDEINNLYRELLGMRAQKL